MVLELVGTSNFKAMQWHKYLLKVIFDTHFWPRFYIVVLGIAFFSVCKLFIFYLDFYIPFLFGLLLPFFISLFFPFFYSIALTFWISSEKFYLKDVLQKSNSVWEATFMQKDGWIFSLGSAGPKIIYVLSVLKKEFDEWVHKRDMQRYIWQI